MVRWAKKQLYIETYFPFFIKIIITGNERLVSCFPLEIVKSNKYKIVISGKWLDECFRPYICVISLSHEIIIQQMHSEIYSQNNIFLFKIISLSFMDMFCLFIYKVWYKMKAHKQILGQLSNDYQRKLIAKEKSETHHMFRFYCVKCS